MLRTHTDQCVYIIGVCEHIQDIYHNRYVWAYLRHLLFEEDLADPHEACSETREADCGTERERERETTGYEPFEMGRVTHV